MSAYDKYIDVVLLNQILSNFIKTIANRLVLVIFVLLNVLGINQFCYNYFFL